jgi:hypothetical protein
VQSEVMDLDQLKVRVLPTYFPAQSRVLAFPVLTH